MSYKLNFIFINNQLLKETEFSSKFQKFKTYEYIILNNLY